jgi:DNA-binding protein YbaB
MIQAFIKNMVGKMEIRKIKIKGNLADHLNDRHTMLDDAIKAVHRARHIMEEMMVLKYHQASQRA